MSIFDEIIPRTNTKCYKWDYNKEIFGKEDLLSMWVADMDFRAPKEVLDVLRERVDHGIFGYTGQKDSFYQAVIDWMKERFDWEIEQEWILTTPGVVAAVNFAIQTYSKEGGGVLVQSPVYFPFFSCIEKNGRRIVNSELKLCGGRYEIDFDDLGKKLSSGVDLMILCSPHNPVGRVWKRDELLKISELCLRYDVLLVSDEIHSDIVFSGSSHIPVPMLSGEISGNSITMFAPSKTFNVAGLSLSAVIIPNNDLRDKYKNKLESLDLHGGNLFGIEAMEAAYRYGKDWLDELLIYLEGNYKFAVQYLEKNELPVKAVKMEGTYLMWLDCREMRLSQKELVDFFVKKAGLALNDGAAFGDGGEGFMRLNLGCSRLLLHRALDQLKSAF